MADLPPIDEELEAYGRGLAEALEDVRVAHSELQPLYVETSESIQAHLRKNADNLNGVQLRQVIHGEFEKTVFRRRKVIAASVESSASRGPRAVRKTFRAVYGDDVTKAQLRTSAKALREGADRIAGRVTVDNVSLSKRIRRWDRRIGEEMAVEVERGIKARKGIEQIAKKIEKLDNVTEGLPKYLQQVEDLARKGGGKELRSLAKKFTARAKKLMGEMQADGSVRASTYSLRSPTTKFLRDIQKTKDIDAVVKTYVEERAAWRAKLIAKNESVEAFRRSYIENSRNKPGVYAYEWTLSPRHPKPDICDVHRNANYYGLGPGRYPADKIPDRHPSCLPPGHMVETVAGKVPIEQIQPGDLVRSHTGEFRKVLRLSQTFWRGEVVEATIGEKRLVMTPEHPLLTARGWVRADELLKGDVAFARVETNDGPPNRREVSVFFGVDARLALCLVPLAGVNLDGQEHAGDRGVNVELSDSKLGDHVQPESAQCRDGALLKGSRTSAPLLARRLSYELIEGHRLASQCGVGTSGHLAAFLGGAPSAGVELLFRQGANLNPHTNERPPHDISRDAERLADGEDASSLIAVEPSDLGVVADNSIARWPAALTQAGAFGSGEPARSSFFAHPGLANRPPFTRSADAHANLAQSPPDDVNAACEAACNHRCGPLVFDIQTNHLDRAYIATGPAVDCLLSGHFYPVVVKQISRHQYTGPVHNFAVETDESYCAEDIVTHNCLCAVVACVDKKHFERAENDDKADLRDDKSPDAVGWLKSNPDAAAAILGPTRMEAMRQGVPVLDSTHQLVPVHSLLPSLKVAAE